MRKPLVSLVLVTSVTLCNFPQAASQDVKPIATLKHSEAFEGAVQSVAFSPDGAMLASAYNVVVGREAAISRSSGQGGRIKGHVVLWDVSTKKKLNTIECTGNVQLVVFHPDGKLLAAAHADQEGRQQIRILDVATGKDRHLVPIKKEGESYRSISAMAFSPDGKSLVIATSGYPQGARLEIIDPATGRERTTLKVDGVSVHSVSFSKDGKLLTAVSDEMVQVWDTTRDRVRNSFATGRGRQAAMSPDGETIALSTTGSRRYPGVVAFTLRGAKTGATLIDFNCPSHGTAVLFTPGGERLIYGYGSGIIAVYEVTTGRRLAVTDGPSFSTLAVNGNGDLLASGNISGTVWLWDIGGRK